MTPMTNAAIVLTPRERQVLEGMSDGSSLSDVARHLRIREATAAGYLKLAKCKLYGMSETAAALAVGYGTDSITCPPKLSPEALFLPREQRDLVPFIGRGMAAAQIATELKRPVDIIRRDGRDLLTNLQARNRAHAITRAWQYRVLTAGEVIAWLR